MNKLKNFKSFSFENNDSSEVNKRIKESKNNLEKVLCNHCGRTASNGIRCLGICVADNEY
tara:strand:+ start:184 stop:363 length:180 start_codon:yes stop_codon:yes gene_type:complete